MKIAYILFNGITYLDFIGVYDPVFRLRSMNYLPDLRWETCSFTEKVKDVFGLEVVPQKVKNDLSVYDVVIVPGGLSTRELIKNDEFIGWIRTSGNHNMKISICTGSLLLGAAGYLKDKKATTNYQAYDTLKSFCKEVVEDRIVEDGNVITAGTVASSLDLGLYLCKKWAGPEAEAEIRKRMGYNG